MAKTKSSAKKTAAGRKHSKKTSSARTRRTQRTEAGGTLRVLLEILLLAGIGFCVLLFAAAFETRGSLSALHVAVYSAFGAASFVVPILLLAAILMILFHGTVGQTLLHLAAVALWIPAACGLAELFVPAGGGKVGYRILNQLNPTVGDIGAYIFLVLMILMGILFVTGQSLIRFLQDNREWAKEVASTSREWRAGEKKIRAEERKLKQTRKKNEALQRQEERLREITAQQQEEEERRVKLRRDLMAVTVLQNTTIDPDENDLQYLQQKEKLVRQMEKTAAPKAGESASLKDSVPFAEDSPVSRTVGGVKPAAAAGRRGSAVSGGSGAGAAGENRPSARNRMHTQTESRLPASAHAGQERELDDDSSLFSARIHFGNTYPPTVEGRKETRTPGELDRLDRGTGGEEQQVRVSAAPGDSSGGVVETVLPDEVSTAGDVYEAAVDAAAAAAEDSVRNAGNRSAGKASAGKEIFGAVNPSGNPAQTAADPAQAFRQKEPGSLREHSAQTEEMIRRAMEQRAEEKLAGLEEAGGAPGEGTAAGPRIDAEDRPSGVYTQALPEDAGAATPREAAAMLSDVPGAGTAAQNPDIKDHVRTIRTSTGKVIRAEIDRVPGEKSTSGTKVREKRPEENSVEMLHYEEPKEYVFPPMDLLSRGKAAGGDRDAAAAALKETAMKLQQTLRTFGVGATVTDISCGPTVTRYELQPERGVKVSQIVNLSDDIKLNLAAEDIRIEAPIPGKAAIGIEVPNREKQAVKLRDLLETEEFRKNRSKIAFAAGKDISGGIVIADIAKMPHLLIAGATGSGKSVCINTIIMSILYKAKPSEVKLLLIDPKVVELSVYNGIPHLLMPVVTDPKKASAALNWAVQEMMRRYQIFAREGVRNIAGFNEKIDAMGKNAPGQDGGNLPQKMSQIVIIIDELADLMMAAPGEVETAICRLAQLARAAGMHLVIATQRPSVKVITGLIKANVPSRIAFAVSSGTDSRIIIDMNGAEKLLGKGDMLYYPAGFPKPLRVQGSFVSDDEVKKVVDFLSEQANVIGGETTEIDLSDSGASAFGGESGPNADRDEYYEKAGYFLIDKDKASIGMLQRMFKIGFNRAARIMDQLADNGVVSQEEGTKARQVLMTKEQFAESLRAG